MKKIGTGLLAILKYFATKIDESEGLVYIAYGVPFFLTLSVMFLFVVILSVRFLCKK